MSRLVGVLVREETRHYAIANRDRGMSATECDYEPTMRCRSFSSSSLSAARVRASFAVRPVSDRPSFYFRAVRDAYPLLWQTFEEKKIRFFTVCLFDIREVYFGNTYDKISATRWRFAKDRV